MFNPYAQGGWTNAENSNARSRRGTVYQSSIFDALPYPTPISPPTFMSFRFISFSPTVLDSAVTGPRSRTYFRITTDTPTVGFTVVHNMVNEPVIIIEWSKHPIIEIRDIVSKRQTWRWLGMSPDKRTEVLLEITAEAVQIGLLEMCIAATLLFKSGRTID
ncbi:hypothetical protein FB451DRAFT_1370373 [Mycena latifolia]|nr:hypothetical protein FB451DRAFT_1370373 [Mycena latifolia]